MRAERTPDVKKVLLVFGTRPEAIKMAPIVRAMAGMAGGPLPVVCVTAQHRQMLDQVLELFAIKPAHDLNIMLADQGLHQITSRVLNALVPVLEEEKPDLVLVHGDTTTTLAASLASYYTRIPVGHVEAGLRTGDRYAPFPEEMNRRVTDCLADLYFAPTESARRNLLAEGVHPARIVVTGNTVIDALLDTVARLDSDSALREHLAARFAFLRGDRRLLLVTGHRRESFGAGLERLCQALKRIAGDRPEVEIVYSVHLNPTVQRTVRHSLQGSDRVWLLEPMDYLAFVYLMRRAYLILTDSGGMQEEAPALRKPVLVMRDITERPEIVEIGGARLVGTDIETLVTEVSRLLDEEESYRTMLVERNPYGDGTAAQRIVDACATYFGGGQAATK